MRVSSQVIMYLNLELELSLVAIQTVASSSMTFKVQTPRNWLVTHTIVQKRMIKLDQLFNVTRYILDTFNSVYMYLFSHLHTKSGI